MYKQDIAIEITARARSLPIFIQHFFLFLHPFSSRGHHPSGSSYSSSTQPAAAAAGSAFWISSLSYATPRSSGFIFSFRTRPVLPAQLCCVGSTHPVAEGKCEGKAASIAVSVLVISATQHPPHVPSLNSKVVLSASHLSAKKQAIVLRVFPVCPPVPPSTLPTYHSLPRGL